jgi:hypothetical protein
VVCVCVCVCACVCVCVCVCVCLGAREEGRGERGNVSKRGWREQTERGAMRGNRVREPLNSDEMHTTAALLRCEGSACR